MIACSSRDKRCAKANLIHEEPKPIKMLSSPLILIARRNESNWSSYIALQYRRKDPLTWFHPSGDAGRPRGKKQISPKNTLENRQQSNMTS